jgi:hypothetical protein
MLLIVTLSGVPYDPNQEQVSDDVERFTHVLLNRRDPDKVFVSLVKYSTDIEDIGFIDYISMECCSMFATSDYQEELRMMKSEHGNDFQYTAWDHIARVLLAPIHAKYEFMVYDKKN